MNDFMGDFIGFTLGDYHSTQLNIVHVTSSDRYEEGITPQFEDQIEVVPGGDGTYYWTSFDTQKTFTIYFAFDNLREEDIRRLKVVLGSKKLQPLIFDETPYKKYMVKAAAPASIKYIPFGVDYQDGVYLCKGEGSVQLVAYYPYGIGVDEITQPSNTELTIANYGDLDMSLRLFYSSSDASNGFTVQLSNGSIMEIDSMEIFSGDTYICIDSKTNLIEGYDANFNRTGTLYNKYLKTGDFFKCPVGQQTVTSTIAWNKLVYYYIYY